MKNLNDVKAELKAIGISDNDITRAMKIADADFEHFTENQGHVVEGFGCGLDFCPGYTAEENNGVAVPPFQYVLIRFDFEDGKHWARTVKLYERDRTQNHQDHRF